MDGQVEEYKKIKLFIDADDTILDSIECIARILNNRYGKDYQLTETYNWNLTNIFPVKEKEVHDIFDTREFFDMVQYKEGFLNFYNSFGCYQDFNIVTITSKDNAEFKKQKFGNDLPVANLICINTAPGQRHSKKQIDMAGGIQIDDRVECLDTNASVKILIRNNKDLEWNQIPINSTIYVVDRWEEIETMITYMFNNQEFFHLC